MFQNYAWRMASSCSLDGDGRAKQLARYAEPAPSVVLVERESRSLSVGCAEALGADAPR